MLKNNNLSIAKSYWENRWENQEIGWDIGYPSPAIVNYINKLSDKTIEIIIPGCGNAYEALHLIDQGFQNITLLDISPTAIKLVKEKFINYPQVKIQCEDFFTHKQTYDLIIEQTFFCAIQPPERKDYATKMHQLLKPGGKLIGLLFNRIFQESGPPFGGQKNEYRKLFGKHFEILKMDEMVESIPQRQGNEVFIEFIKLEPTITEK